MKCENGRKATTREFRKKKRGSAVPANFNQVNHRLDCWSETEPHFAAKQTRKHVLTQLSPTTPTLAWHSSSLWLRIALSLQGCGRRKKGEQWTKKTATSCLKEGKETQKERKTCILSLQLSSLSLFFCFYNKETPLLQFSTRSLLNSRICLLCHWRHC